MSNRQHGTPTFLKFLKIWQARTQLIILCRTHTNCHIKFTKLRPLWNTPSWIWNPLDSSWKQSQEGGRAAGACEAKEGNPLIAKMTFTSILWRLRLQLHLVAGQRYFFAMAVYCANWVYHRQKRGILYLNLFVVDENHIGSLTATKICWVSPIPFGIPFRLPVQF